MSVSAVSSSPPPAIQTSVQPPSPPAKVDRPNDGDADDRAAAPKAPPPGQGKLVDVRA